jgi:dCTP diphosphatase
VRVGACPEPEACRAAITLATLSVYFGIVRSHGILAAVSDLEAIRVAARKFREERDWEQFQDPKSVLLALVGEVGEIAELLQWLPADRAKELITQEPLHTRVADELADVLVYLVGLADQCGVDLGIAALAKIEKSAAKHPVGTSRGVAPDRTSE